MPEGKPRREWRFIRCPHCDGHGIVSVYSGYDFEGPGECPDCEGRGGFAVSPQDRIAKYPGGPFMGMWPGAYKEAKSDEA